MDNLCLFFELRYHLGHCFGELSGLLSEDEDGLAFPVFAFTFEAALGDHQVGFLLLE